MAEVLFRGIRIREAVPGSPEENYSLDRGQATQKFFIPWNRRAAFRTQALGYTAVRTYPNSGDRYLSRVTPLWFPDEEDVTNGNFLWADSVRLSDVKTGIGQDVSRHNQFARRGDETHVARYAEALATVGFATRPYHVASDENMLDVQRALEQANTAGVQSDFPDESILYRYVSGEFVPKIKFQSIPAFRALRFNQAGTPVTNLTGVSLYSGGVEITWYHVPLEAVPWEAIQECMNRTNHRPFGALAGPLQYYLEVFDAGTLLMMAPQIKQHRMPNGAYAANITYRFDFQPNGGVNSFYNWTENRFENASRDGQSSINPATGQVTGDENKLFFPPADYRNLFRPRQAQAP